jgi:uncharacterized protein (DUF1499 family)
MSSTSRSLEARPAKPLIAMVGFAFGVAAVLMLLAAPFGFRFGLLSLRVALQEMPSWATYLGMTAIVVGLLGLITAFRLHRIWAILALVGAVLGLGITLAPWAYQKSLGGPPPINDITTDTENPPPFVAVIPLREAARPSLGGGALVSANYGGSAVAELQKKAYPDIQPLMLALPPSKVFDLALDEARKSGWTIVATDQEQGRIEATDRTGWYGFTDDIVLRIQSDGTGTRLDMRSHSRVGRGDRGKNAERIRAFLSSMRSAAAHG